MQKHPQLLRRPLPPNLPKLSLCQKKVHAVMEQRMRGTGVAKRSYPTSKIKSSQEELPHVRGQEQRLRGVTPRPRSGAAAERRYSTSKVRSSSHEEIPHIQVGTGEISLPRVHFIQEKTASFERDKTSFPVVPRDRAQTPVSIQTLFLDHHVQRRVMTISTTKKSSKHVYWHIPETATGSIFFPRCRSASARVFGKEVSKMEGAEKSEGPLKIQNIYTSILKDILILSSEFSRVPSATPSVPSRKLKEVHSEHFLQEGNIYTFKQPLLRLSATVPIPVPRTTPVKAASQWSGRVHSRTVTLNITDFPGPMFIPSPVLPRKPLRQSVIESRVTEHEPIETVPTQSMLSLHEDSIKSKKIDPTVVPVVQGEGFKTIVATRYETILAMTNLAIINCQVHGRNALNLKGFFLLNCPDLTPLAFQLVYLNLSYNNISDFPTEIYCLKNLQILNLRNNPIKEIPSTIQQLKLLKSLNVAFNLITTLPPG